MTIHKIISKDKHCLLCIDGDADTPESKAIALVCYASEIYANWTIDVIQTILHECHHAEATVLIETLV